MRISSLTPVCLATLIFICEYHNAHKYAPSQREICEKLDELRSTDSDALTSTSVVKYQIDKLIGLKYLQGEGRIARGYAPTDLGMQVAQQKAMPDHAYQCVECRFTWTHEQVNLGHYFLTCQNCGGLVIDITASNKGMRFIQKFLKFTEESR